MTSLTKDDYPDNRMALARLLLTGATVVLGGSFHFGYQISLINPLADVLQAFIEGGLRGQDGDLLADEPALRDALWASVAGVLFAGALVGALVAPPLLERLGARRVLLVASLILCTSFALAAGSRIANAPLAFIVGRLISGLGIGLVTAVQTVYLTEISPVRHRGLMGTLTGFATSVGFVIASGVGMPQVIGTADYWHYAYFIETIPSLILIAALLTLLEESPVYSMRYGQIEAAWRCIRLYHSPGDESEARSTEISAEIAADKHADANFAAILRNRAARNALLICVLLNATVSFSGILAISFFGTLLLQEIGFSDRSAALANCVASFSGILGNLAGSLAIDRVGRRKLIIGGLCSLAALNTALMALVFALNADVRLGYGFLGVFMLFLFAFNCGVGPMAWFLATELSTAGARSHIQSASVACQYATCFVSPLIFFPLYQRGGGASFLVFIVPLVFTAAYLFVHLPETRGRSTSAIVAALGAASSSSRRSAVVDDAKKLPAKAKRTTSAAIYATQMSPPFSPVSEMTTRRSVSRFRF